MSKSTILIVEDEAIVAEDLAGKVRQLGYEVAGTLATGEEAVAFVRCQRPALVLMDVRLAGEMDGISATMEIHRFCDVPVVFLTAHSDEGTVKRAQQADAFGYILKPFSRRDLRIQIEMAIYKHATEQRLRASEERIAGTNRILSAALSCESECELGAVCLDVARKITGSRYGFIGEINEAGMEINAVSNPAWESRKILDIGGHRAPSANFRIHGIYGRVLLDGESVIANDLAHNPECIDLPEGHPPLASFLGVPLTHEGNIIGMIAVGNREGGYSQEEQEALETLTPAIVQSFKRIRAEEHILTLNRELENRVLERTAKLNETVAALEDEIFHRHRLEREILEISEREQCRLGQDLHDGLGQELSGIAMLGDVLTKQLMTQTNPLADTAEKLANYVREALDTTRRLAKGHYPIELEHHGLMIALQNLADQTSLRTHIHCELRHNGVEPKLEKAAEIHIYRIIQESIGNAVKHALPSQIIIESQGAINGSHTFSVTDNGKGFSEPADSRGMGLHLMRYRARLIGADIAIEQIEVGGCRIICQLRGGDSKGGPHSKQLDISAPQSERMADLTSR